VRLQVLATAGRVGRRGGGATVVEVATTRQQRLHAADAVAGRGRIGRGGRRGDGRRTTDAGSAVQHDAWRVRLHVRVLQLLLLLHVLRVILLLRVGRQEMLLVVLLRIWEIDGLLRLLLGREDASRCTVGCVWCSDCRQERRAGEGQ
jgi:hypothetical protein